jgi:spore coat protein CotH
MGPLWDFDYGFDFVNPRLNPNNKYFGNAEKMFFNSTFEYGSGQVFFSRFFDDPVFRSKYKERWNERYVDLSDMETFIDKTTDFLSESRKADSAVWHWWKKRNHRQEVEDMKTWWRKRIAYLNEEINKF